MIAEVFEELLASIDQYGREENEGGWDDEVSEALILLRASYDVLTKDDRTVIDYSDPATQAAYVYAYAIGRAEFTYQLLKRHRAELGAPIFGGKVARVSSLGGGPGSEIAGLVKYLLDEENGEIVEAIKFRVFDKDQAWLGPCTELVNEVSNLLPVELVFEALDLTDTEACSNISLEGDDLLILSFVISELCALEESGRALESLRGLYKTLDRGSSIFYNDSNASSFYYFFNESRKFVTGIARRASQKSEIVDNITFSAQLGDTYEEYSDRLGSTPHMTSDALSKFIQRP